MNEDLEITMNDLFLKKAKEMTPQLHSKTVRPKNICRIHQGNGGFQGVTVEALGNGQESKEFFDLGDSVIYDMGEHLVGYVSFRLESVGAPADSPVRLRLLFAETPYELTYDSSQSKSGWISYAWMQEETLTAVWLTGMQKISRRLAFRYMKVELVEKSTNFAVRLSDIEMEAQSAAGFAPPEIQVDQRFQEIAEVSARTLRNCMHTVYEDGPKRDRRLWVGDLRLQALTDYKLYRCTGLVKRCLYLFAGLADSRGRIPACLYEKPAVCAGDIYLYDYTLIYMAALADYYYETEDRETAGELFDLALLQFKVFVKQCAPQGEVLEQEGWWCFIDWNDQLPKRAPMQGVAIYCMEKGRALAASLGRREDAAWLGEWSEKLKQSAVKAFFNERTGLFEEEGKVSWAACCWLLLGGVLPQEAVKVMKRLQKDKKALRPVTPYVYHYVAECMEKLGMQDELQELLLGYWGSMVKNGADTFWEAYREEEPFLSPYGDCYLNSACHAWSCTPIYFLQGKQLTEGEGYTCEPTVEQR